MSVRTRVNLSAAALAAVVGILAACGGGADEPGETPGQKEQVVKIGVVAPLSGDLAEIGGGLRNGVKLAVQQANARNAIPGWEIELAVEDDEAKPDTGARAASKLASDSRMIGIVGPLNSSVALTVAPVLSRQGIAEISPANTGVSLTGRDATPQVRPYRTYFRVVATDDYQGPFAARYLVQDRDIRRIAIVHDKKAYGQGLADSFRVAARDLGATVLPTQTVTPGDKDFSAVVSRIQAQHPQAVYYGGEYPEAALLTRQLKAMGVDVPVIGGDGMFSAKFIKTGGSATEGDLVTNLGAPTGSSPAARQFLVGYAAAHFKEDHDPYAGYAYDATNVLIQAARKALTGRTDIDPATQAAEVAAVQATRYSGVTGRIAFDRFGDTTTKVLTMWTVRNGAFHALSTENFR
jgi:branched-chain amino acid transport system substrate-binding protein